MTSMTDQIHAIPLGTTAAALEFDIIASVAQALVARDTADDPKRKSLFAIVGFNSDITSSIARRLGAADPAISININPRLSDGSLPVAWVNSNSAGHFRNMKRLDGSGSIVFAVPTDHLSVVGSTLGEVKQISEETLSQPELWFQCCPDIGTIEREKSYVANFLQGARQAGLFVSGLPMLARFMILLNKIAGEKNIERALDESLPALRIPRNAGRFRPLSKKGRVKSVEAWKIDLEEIQSKTEAALYLTNERGAPLNRSIILDRLQTFLDEDKIDQLSFDTFAGLLADRTIEVGHWRPSQEQVVQNLEWDVIERILKSTKQAKKAELGEATIKFFHENFTRDVTKEDEVLLQGISSEARQADEFEKDFFFRKRDFLREDKKILKRWESFIFKNIEVHSDPLVGIVQSTAEMLAAVEEIPEDPRVVVVLEGADKKAFWKSKNTALVDYIRNRYRGLREILAPSGVILDFGMCWSDKFQLGEGHERSSITARQFKFDLFLVAGADLDPETPFEVRREILKKAVASSQLTLVMPPNSFANAYAANMHEVANGGHPFALLMQGRFSRSHRSGRAADGIIDLGDRATVLDAHDSPDGILLDPNDPDLNIGNKVRESLVKLSGSILPPQDAVSIGAALDAFQSAYTDAVRAFADGSGLADRAVLEQSRLFGELLGVLRKVARKDECREKLWMPILSIGIAKSTDKPHVAISCPWHPFRLAEAVVKAQRFSEALREMIGNARNGSSLRAYAQLRTEAMHLGWHPTMSIVPDQPKPRLLIESDYFADFGLMEPPTADQGAQDAFDGYAKEATDEFLSAANEYLELSPHERANFSVVLYNADNRDLPSRFAEQLARKIENESDLRCEIILTHTDPQRLREIYAEQNVTISRELDGVIASEAAQNFLSRLRVGFLNVDTVPREEDSGYAADIVFLQDVIARSAQTNWRKCEAPENGWPSFLDHNPNSETRRQSHEQGSRKTEVLLVPTERPREVQSFVDLVHDLHTDEQDTSLDHFVPIREVKFDNRGVSRVIEAAHQVAKWVVTFDGIADRQLLLNNDISVIRFVSRVGSNHNVIISTKESSAVLLDRIIEQVDKLMGGAKLAQRKLAEKLIKEAALMSGRLVLRAARIENNALELLGLVLCRQILIHSISKSFIPVTWLLLDDFAGALGQKDGKRADLLIVSLGMEGEQKIVDLIVLESKFVSESSYSAEARSSLEQTRASTNDLRDRLVLNGDPLNQSTWRTRLANMIIEHGMFDGDPFALQPKHWVKGLRTGTIPLRIRGISMVFLHDCKGEAPTPMASDWSDQQQYVFGRSSIVGALKGIGQGVDTFSVVIEFPEPTYSIQVPVTSEIPDTRAPEPVDQTIFEVSEVVSQVPAIPSQAVVEPKVVPSSDGLGQYPVAVQNYVREYPPSPDEVLVEEWLARTTKDLKKALKGYNLDAEVLGQRLTPNSALIRFRGSDRMTLDDISRRKTLLLTSHSIDVVDARPGAGEVVAVVRRPNRAILSLPDIWKKRGLGADVPNQNGSFLLGEKEMDGAPLYLNLSGKFGGQPQHGPHTLIAGETGGGKGVLARNIILDILATNSPESARIRFVDPKYGADYPWLSEMPHLDGGIVTDQEHAIETLKALVDEMERRFQLITQEAKMPNIDAYNLRASPSERLPRIYLFHDEIGDWMADKNSDYPGAVSNYVVRLASKARAAGVHLTLITQRPDAAAMPSQIKANINNKICLRVGSNTNSRIVLDEAGGETLLGQGHFIAKLANEPVLNGTSLIYAQAPFMPDEDAWELAQAIRSHWG